MPSSRRSLAQIAHKLHIHAIHPLDGIPAPGHQHPDEHVLQSDGGADFGRELSYLTHPTSAARMSSS